jgi:ABC-type antimicrobial peptide transport system permease subunit
MEGLMDFFLFFGIALLLLISFFGLMASSFANVMQSKKEIGILKVLGVSNLQLIKIYLYEVFLVTFTASILGTLSGLTLAWSTVLQRKLWTTVPLILPFRWKILVINFISAIILSLLSSLKPLLQISKQTIIQLLRN